jgi:hypothetical protein
MKKIELSISTAMSLLAMSSAGAENENEDEHEQDDGVEVDALSMSDEEFEKMSPDDFAEASEEDDNDDNEDDNEEDTLGDDDEDDSETDVNEDEPTDNAEDGGSEQTEDKDDSKETQPNEEERKADEARYNEAFKLLYGKPIKASGREVQIRNPEHARNFIEMGIDYNKKMQSMKPHMSTLKTLEREGLLDPSKADRLNLLLEVEKGNKDALKRLIAESDIDPLDLADEEVIEEGRNYQPQNHMMSAKEVEIEEALNTIEGTPSQQRTLDVMTKEFDPRSREVISDNPSYIVALNNDISTGVYDEVMKEVQYKRDMRLVPSDMSDIEVYLQTVMEGTPGQVNAQQETKPQRKQANKSSRSAKQKMSGNKATSKTNNKQYDPMQIMDMSDDEFNKKFSDQLQ